VTVRVAANTAVLRIAIVASAIFSCFKSQTGILLFEGFRKLFRITVHASGSVIRTSVLSTGAEANRQRWQFAPVKKVILVAPGTVMRGPPEALLAVGQPDLEYHSLEDKFVLFARERTVRLRNEKMSTDYGVRLSMKPRWLSYKSD
jgi:hypothetical protein